MGAMKDLWIARQEQANEAAAAAMEAVMEGRAYPYKAGWKDPGISRDNAERIDKAGTLGKNQTAMLALFQSGFSGTADEAGERLGLSPFAARPAATHLRKLGKIERTPERRRGAGGGEAAVLVLKRGAP